MDGATKQISEYIRKKGFNLSEISRKTGVPYMALYDSVANEKRDRDLRVDEFLALCKHLELDPRVISVIETQALRGSGTERDKCRIVTQYWDFDGNLLAENDPCAKEKE